MKWISITKYDWIMLVMQNFTSQKIYLPPPGKSFWIPDESLQSVLLYHSWGTRDFHLNSFPPTLHDGDSDLFVLKGKAELDLGKKTIPINYPSYLSVPSHIPQGWRKLKHPESAIVFCWIWAKQESSASERSVVTHQHLIPELSKKVLWAHRETRWTQNLPPIVAFQHLQSIRRCLDTWIEHLDPLNDASLKKETFIKAKQWILQYLSRPQKVQDLADYLGLSLLQLHQLFQMNVRSTPDQYIQKMKYSEAKKLLRNSKKSIKQIAYELGYLHANDFSRAFKKWSGESPSARGKIISKK